MNHSMLRSVEVYSLASGSSGNATLIKANGASILIDAGLGIRKMSSLLHGKGILADGLNAILVTHEHIDHTSGLGPLSRRGKVPVITNRQTLEECAIRDPIGFETQELEAGDTIAVGSAEVTAFRVPHDAVEPMGYFIRVGGAKIVYFTDAGSILPCMREALVGANLVIAEANHDLEWLLRGPYTREMKMRVRSDTGHLSNDDCADLIAERLDNGGPMAVWLAHLSRVNNSPSLAKRSVEHRILARTKTAFTLDIALRDSPSAEWRSGAGTKAVQLSLL